ncbi:MAG: hypothetical protein ABFC24_11495 [Methanoregulaceae archaeon]
MYATENKLRSPEITSKLNEIFLSSYPNGGNLNNSSLFQEKHGLISARLLLFLLNQKHGSSWSEEANDAIKAIILHTGQTGNETIDVRTDPLSALLLICDELQEWGRPRSVYSPYYEKDMKSLKIDIDNGNNSENAKIIYNYPKSAILEPSREEDKKRNLGRLIGISMENKNENST